MKYKDMPVGTVIVGTKESHLCVDVLVAKKGRLYTWLHLVKNYLTEAGEVTTVTHQDDEGLNESIEEAFLPGKA